MEITAIELRDIISRSENIEVYHDKHQDGGYRFVVTAKDYYEYSISFLLEQGCHPKIQVLVYHSGSTHELYVTDCAFNDLYKLSLFLCQETLANVYETKNTEWLKVIKKVTKAFINQAAK